MRSPDVDLLQPAGRLTGLKLDLNLLLSEQNGLLGWFFPLRRENHFTLVFANLQSIALNYNKKKVGNADAQKTVKLRKLEHDERYVSYTQCYRRGVSLVLVQAAYEPGITTIAE